MKNFRSLKLTSLILLAFVILSVTSCIGPGNNSDVINKTFPSVKGTDLLGKMVNIPDIFQGNKILVAVGFKREHQKEMKNWASYINQIIKTNNSIKFYTLLVTYKTNFIRRIWINNMMKFSTTKTQEKCNTITIYTDQKKFSQYLNMKLTQSYLVVLDKNKNILQIIKGNPDADKLQKLNKTLNQ